jgi:hypothetical protein
VRLGRGRRVERRVVGQGGIRQGSQDQQGAGGYHGCRGERRLPDRLGSVGQGCRSDGQGHRPSQGGRAGDEDQDSRPDSHRSGSSPLHRRQPAAPHRPSKGRGAGHQPRHGPRRAARRA